MVKNKSSKAGKSESDSKLFAFLAVLLSVVGFLVAYITKKEDKYVMFYAKQSLILFFGWLIVWIVSMVLFFIPFLHVIILLAQLGLLVLWIVGLVYSVSGEMKDIPLVGPFADKFSF